MKEDFSPTSIMWGLIIIGISIGVLVGLFGSVWILVGLSVIPVLVGFLSARLILGGSIASSSLAGLLAASSIVGALACLTLPAWLGWGLVKIIPLLLHK